MLGILSMAMLGHILKKSELLSRGFGGASAAYSLRDIGAMGGKVVSVRRDSDNETDSFSAIQLATGAVETFVGSGNNGFVKYLDHFHYNKMILKNHFLQ